MNKNHVFDIATIEVNGQLLNLGEGNTFQFGGKVREEVVGDSGIFFKQKNKPAEVKANIVVTKGLSLATINGWDNVSVTFKCDTGQIYSMANAWVAEMGEIGGDAVEVTFKANKAEEVTTG